MIGNSLPSNNSQITHLPQQNGTTSGWVEILPEWAYWISPESFNLKRVKKRAPIGTIIIVKSKEKTDDERTYVNESFGQVIETGILKLTKKEASVILTRQFIEYAQTKKQWPPFTSIKTILKSGEVQVLYEPTEYDSFILHLNRQMLNLEPQEFLHKLKKFDTPQAPVWKVETAKSGRSRCRSCNDFILEGRFRLGEPYFYEGNISYKWFHPRCLTSTLDVADLESFDGYKNLQPDEKFRLKRIFNQQK